MKSQLDQIFASGTPDSQSSDFSVKQQSKKLLFYGIGNVGREDDGLGIRLIENLENTQLPANIDLDSNYQLNIEDALEISSYDRVVFVDATVESKAKAPFEIREILPSTEITFSTHAMTMENVLALCDQLYGRAPKAFVLTLPGYRWEIVDRLSEQAYTNLECATQCLKDWLATLDS